MLEQLAEAMPDENDVNKPAKVDCDAEGRGGDDGGDMFRYGVATKLRAVAPASATLERYEDKSWRTVKDGAIRDRRLTDPERRRAEHEMERLMGGATPAGGKYTRRYQAPRPRLRGTG